MRILEVKFLAVIVALLTTIAGYMAIEKKHRDDERLAQEQHRLALQKALRSAPVIKMDGIATAGYKQ